MVNKTSKHEDTASHTVTYLMYLPACLLAYIHNHTYQTIYLFNLFNLMYLIYPLSFFTYAPTYLFLPDEKIILNDYGI